MAKEREVKKGPRADSEHAMKRKGSMKVKASPSYDSFHNKMESHDSKMLKKIKSKEDQY